MLITNIIVKITSTHHRAMENIEWKSSSDNSHSCPRITGLQLNIIDHKPNRIFVKYKFSSFLLVIF